MKQIRLKEFVLDFDNLRKGTVTKDQFKRLMMQCTVSLNPAEFDTLMSVYEEADGRVNYRDFINDMDRVFTQNDIDKDPLFKVT